MLKGQSQQIEHLLVIEDDQGKRTVVLEAATYSIGRDLGNSIVLHSQSVSRQHAILLRVTMPDASYLFRIIDGNLQGKGSRNGLLVNNQRCFSHELKHGDVITFGHEIQARYYATENSSDVKFLTSCQTEEVSGFLSNLSNPFPIVAISESEQRNCQEAAMVRLASFPELISHPILEIDLLAGRITYLNPAAVIQFPNIQEAKLEHPILAGIISKVKNDKEKFFTREVEVANYIFEQSVHYFAESDLIRSYVVDITQRKQVEAAFQNSQQRLELAQRVGKIGTFEWNIQTNELNWTAELEALYGIAPGSFSGKYDSWLQAMHPDDRFGVDKAIWQAVSNGTELDIEFRILLPDANVRWMAVRSRILADEAGKPVGMIGVNIDISDRKLAEAALQKAHNELEIRVEQRTAELKKINEQLVAEVSERQRTEVALEKSFATNRALLNAIPDWMFRISRDGIFVNFKEAKNAHPPIPTKEFLGKNLYEVLPNEVAEPFMEGVNLALITGEMQIVEYQLLLNNKLLDYEARIAVSAKNEVMAIVRDITKRKQAEADIRKALQTEKELGELKSRFITMASHEFRTPLAAILSSSELIEHYSHKWSEDKKLNHLQRIQTSVKHMTKLLDDVLLIGKAEAGKLELKPSMINLLQFCRDLVEEIEVTTSAHQINFCTQGKDTTAWLDEKLLRHILSNLLSNAIKYSPEGGIVNFDLFWEEEVAIFRIQDCGIGIPLAEQAHIFNSFHRASNVGNISGTGLGLAIVKKSVDLHGGDISLESEFGVGTMFTVTLPLHK